MISLEIKSCMPLTCDCNCPFKGITSDCHYYYLTCPDCCKVFKYDGCFNLVECIDVCRPYGALCFDCKEQCFWALSSKPSNRVYKLDCCFCEIDCLTAKSSDCGCLLLEGVACTNSTELIVCGCFGILTISKYDGHCCSFEKDANCEGNCSAISYTGYGLITAVEKMKASTLTWKSEYCKEYLQCCLPDCYKTEDITCNCDENCCWVYVLVTKRCLYSYLLLCKVCSVKEEGHHCNPKPHKCCYDYNEKCPLPFIPKPPCISIEFTPPCIPKPFCPCYDDYPPPCIPKPSCPCYDCPPPCMPKPSCPCYDCPPPCMPKPSCPCYDCPPKDCCKSAAGIIESISLIEASISHILNAEGEKIQKILCESDDPCEIMKVNEAVHKTIISITHLEQVLYAKLQTAQELCEDKKCNPCKPKH